MSPRMPQPSIRSLYRESRSYLEEAREKRGDRDLVRALVDGVNINRRIIARRRADLRADAARDSLACGNRGAS